MHGSDLIVEYSSKDSAWSVYYAKNRACGLVERRDHTLSLVENPCKKALYTTSKFAEQDCAKYLLQLEQVTKTNAPYTIKDFRLNGEPSSQFYSERLSVTHVKTGQALALSAGDWCLVDSDCRQFFNQKRHATEALEKFIETQNLLHDLAKGSVKPEAKETAPAAPQVETPSRSDFFVELCVTGHVYKIRHKGGKYLYVPNNYVPGEGGPPALVTNGWSVFSNQAAAERAINGYILHARTAAGKASDAEKLLEEKDSYIDQLKTARDNLAHKLWLVESAVGEQVAEFKKLKEANRKYEETLGEKNKKLSELAVELTMTQSALSASRAHSKNMSELAEETRDELMDLKRERNIAPEPNTVWSSVAIVSGMIGVLFAIIGLICGSDPDAPLIFGTTSLLATIAPICFVVSAYVRFAYNHAFLTVVWLTDKMYGRAQARQLSAHEDMMCRLFDFIDNADKLTYDGHNYTARKGDTELHIANLDHTHFGIKIAKGDYTKTSITTTDNKRLHAYCHKASVRNERARIAETLNP